MFTEAKKQKQIKALYAMIGNHNVVNSRTVKAMNPKYWRNSKNKPASMSDVPDKVFGEWASDNIEQLKQAF